MELSELYTKYKLSQEEQDFVDGLIEAEKTKAITETGKKGKELKIMVTERNKLRDILRAELEVDPESETLAEDVKAAKEKFQKAVKSGGNDEVEKLRKEFGQKITTLETQLVTEKNEKLEAKKTIRRDKLSNLLMKALGGEEDCPSARFITEGLLASGTVKVTEDENETPVFVLNGENVTIEKGVADLFKKQPALKRNRQTPGSGGTSNDGIVKGADGKEKMKEKDWEAMRSKDPKAAAAWINDPKHELIYADGE